MRRLKKDFEHYSAYRDFIRYGERSGIWLDLNTIDIPYLDHNFAEENSIFGYSYSMHLFDENGRYAIYRLTRFYFKNEEDKTKFILKN